MQCDPDAIPWRERIALLARHAEAFASPNDEMLAVLDALAGDAKWEVRRQVAELLAQAPEEAFRRLGARLTEDQNSYVRKAAERSLDRRRKGQQVSARRRQMFGGVADDYELMEKLHGSLATKMSRQIAERLYDVLVGATIHNMRGLLTPITSSAQSLLDQANQGRIDAAEARKHLKRIVDATGDLSRLMEEVRRYSQQVPAERRRERLQALVSESVENAKACFSQSGHDVELVSLRMEVPAEITVDVSKVHLVVALTNLLQNSFDAFKPVMDRLGPFWIAVSAHLDDAGEVAITIEDNGIGFGADDLRQVRQFIPGQTTLKHDGTGFGLPTAKRYIEAHGGSLEIDSEENKGTRVRIRLPLTDTEE
uniref:histidine kinase n=1 Tax=Schlesneria paludicola TaxID=360056 RepID=A0A7C4QPM8_9PLAN